MSDYADFFFLLPVHFPRPHRRWSVFREVMKIMCKALLVFMQNHQFLLHLKASAWELSDCGNHHEIPEWAFIDIPEVLWKLCVLSSAPFSITLEKWEDYPKIKGRNYSQSFETQLFWIWFWTCRWLKSDPEIYCQVNRPPRGVRLVQMDFIFRSVGYIKACLHMACVPFLGCLTWFKFL